MRDGPARSIIRGMIRLAAVLAVATASLGCATAATAATTVSFSGDVVSVTGDDGSSSLRTSGYFTDVQLEDDSGAPVTAGAGCVQSGPSAVTCGSFGPTTRVVAALGGGDDRYKWATINASQEVDGGPGNDTIETGAGKDTVRGGAGDDDLDGGRGDDALDGGEGTDTVDGWEGNDTVTGGPGRDTLLGDGATVYAPGNDTIAARDGEGDSVDCGGGADSAQVDAIDAVNGCEQVDSGASPGPAPPGPGPGPGPTPPGPTPAPLAVAGSLGRIPSLKRLRLGTPIAIRLTTNAACTGRVALAVSRTQARRTRLGRKAITLGTSARFTLAAGSAKTVKLTLKKSSRRKLRRVKRLKASVLIACANSAGGRFTGEATVTLKR